MQTKTPITITAGDSVLWKLSILDYPASDGWGIIYAFVKDGGLFSVESTPEGVDHVFAISSTDSASLDPGLYRFQAYAKNGETRETFLTGTLEVTPDFYTQTGGYDNRTPAEKTLDTLKATYDKIAAKALASKSSGGVAVADKQLSEIRAEIEAQDRVVRDEKRAALRKAGVKKSRTIKARFQ